MPVTKYDSIGGEIISESTGGVAREYVPDALGSVVATLDSSKAVTSTARYKPSGVMLSSSGGQPSFGWIGALGYRQSTPSGNTKYVRTRHLDVLSACWSSRDPLWPFEPAYAYVRGRPTVLADPAGLQSGSIWPIAAQWVDLTNATLDEALYQKHRRYFSPSEKGRIFEKCVLEALGVNKYRGRSFPSRWRSRFYRGYYGTIPDASTDLKRLIYRFPLELAVESFPDSLFIEAKVGSGTLGLYDSSGQIGGMLDWLSERSPITRLDDCVPWLVFATTSDLSISPTIIDASIRPEAYFGLPPRKPVALFQTTPTIKEICNGPNYHHFTGEVRFAKLHQINVTGTKCKMRLFYFGGKCQLWT